MKFPKEKLLGIDDITNKMLQKCWCFLKTDCIRMVQTYCENGIMFLTILANVIKLIPKMTWLGYQIGVQ